MAKHTAGELNQLYALFAADPNKAGRFWPALRAYVVRCAYSIPSAIKEDVTQNTLVSILTSLPSFRPGADFVRWVNGICRHERANGYRALYNDSTVSISQLGAWQEDGSFTAFDPAELLDQLDESDILGPEGRALKATQELNTVRASFKVQVDRDLFDLLRSGKTLTQAALSTGQSYAAIQRRFARWKNKDVAACLMSPCFHERNTVKRKQAA